MILNKSCLKCGKVGFFRFITGGGEAGSLTGRINQIVEIQARDKGVPQLHFVKCISI